MLSEQRIRAVLFYLSLVIFFAGLPYILSFSLGYKFNPRTFKFTQTGLISVKTQPQGARIYLDSNLISEKTPATLEELLPGYYSVRLELEGHYPWMAQVNVEPRKVARLEKVILFPVRPNIKKINQGIASAFYADKDKGKAYYLNPQERSLYVSDMDSGKTERVGRIAEDFVLPAKEIRVSPDREKACFFNKDQVCVVYLNPEAEQLYGRRSFVLLYSGERIIHLFWHSDSYHLVLVTEKDIAVTEASPHAYAVSLVSLNKGAGEFSYDEGKDALYFQDNQRAADGATYEGVYKLDLNSKHSILVNLIKPSQNEK
jgi:hypothetical protein